MKKSKISLVAVIAVIIAFAGSAFTVKHSDTKKADTFYFKYVPNSPEGLMTESNWVTADGPTDGCSESSGVNCIIHLSVAPVDGQPDFTTAGISNTGDIDLVTDSRKGE